VKQPIRMLSVGACLGAVLVLHLIASSALAQVDAVTTARYDLKLGFTVGGKITKLNVKAGDRVEAGQIMLELEDEEGKALVELYQLRAASDIEVKAAAENLALSKVEEKATRQAYERNAANPIELERAQVKVRVQQCELDLAQRQREEVLRQLRQAVAKHEQYQLRAPTAGVVDLINVEIGESVEPLKPVLKRVVKDPLWVDASVPLAQTPKLKVGDSAWVQSKLPGHDQPVEGKILHLAEVADAASDTRLVRIEVPNAQGVPAGAHVTVRTTPPTGAKAVSGSR